MSRRVLAVWCALTFVVAGVAAAVEQQPEPHTAVASVGGDDPEPTTTSSTSETTTLDPTTTSTTPPTTTPQVIQRPPSGRAPHEVVPAPPGVPFADRPGFWLVAADGSRARFLADIEPRTCHQQPIVWRADSSGFLFTHSTMTLNPPTIREVTVAGSVQDVLPVTQFAVSPATGRVAHLSYDGGPSGLSIVDADLSSNRVTIPHDVDEPFTSFFTFSPDGQRLAIVTYGNIRVVRADDGIAVQPPIPITDAIGQAIQLAGSVTWSTDGEWLVFDGTPAAVRVATGELRMLPVAPSSRIVAGPGSQVLLSELGPAGNQLQLVDVATGEKRTVLDDHTFHGWARTGGVIAWSGGPDPGLHTVSPDGTPGPDLLAVGTRTVTEGSDSWLSHFGIGTVSFSPDGQWIAAVVC